MSSRSPNKKKMSTKPMKATSTPARVKRVRLSMPTKATLKPRTRKLTDFSDNEDDEDTDHIKLEYNEDDEEEENNEDDEDSDEEDEDNEDEDINWQKLEEDLERNAARANLSTVNVKSILHVSEHTLILFTFF